MSDNSFTGSGSSDSDSSETGTGSSYSCPSSILFPIDSGSSDNSDSGPGYDDDSDSDSAHNSGASDSSEYIDVDGDPNNHVVVSLPLSFRTQYDPNLTAAHRYLGNGLLETTGRTIFEENVIHTIPVIFLKLNLTPGQILPIIATTYNVKILLKYALFRNRVFGVSYKYHSSMRTYGTIAEIFEHSVDIESAPSFQVKAMGHQRYEILSIEPFIVSDDEDIVFAKIKILRDVTLTYPQNQLCLNPHKRHSKQNEMCLKRDMCQTPWPHWVYKQFDPNVLVSKITNKVKMLFEDLKMSDDPSVFSFQVTRLGLFTKEQVANLIGLESANLRLRYELHYWDKNQPKLKFMCINCGAPVCNMSNMFAMSPEGPHGTYCNPMGQIHDMITVTKVDYVSDFVSVGHASSECSWFPGYKWKIILCPGCHNHLGWHYTADDDLSLKPRSFYGLTTASITSIKNLLPDQDEDNFEQLDEVINDFDEF